MGISIFVIGESGRGKSSSIEKLNPEETLVIKVINKPFPFKSKEWKRWDQSSKSGSFLTTDNYTFIQDALKNAKSLGKKVIVIDDVQYLMANEFMKRSAEKGFDKFTEIAKNMWSLITTANELTDDNTRVYFLSHSESKDDGSTKAKTIGRLLDDKITLEGMFSIVLGAEKRDDKYFFTTQNNGRNTCKSPRGMFEQLEIDNDLKFVDDSIKEYYGY